MKKRVVITGIGAVTSVGLNWAESWQGLKAGQSGIGLITKFNTELFNVKIAGEVKGFNPDLYIAKKEQKKMDTFIHYAMACSKMAFEQAKLTIDDQLAERTGCYIGVGMGGLPMVEEQMQKFLEKGPDRISPFFIPGVITNLASGQVSIAFNIRGPNLAITSACASGAHAIGEAMRLIQLGEVDVMVAGGVESTVCPLAIGGFASMKALSTRNQDPTQASRPYDQDRDGFVLAEGGAVFIIESLEHALKRQAPILCEVTGYGASSDAYHITSPAPEGAGGGKAMIRALKNAGLKPSDIQYVNAHGTSTPAGDELETLAIKNVFQEHTKKLWVSSTKSMIGHALGAAGAIESAVCISALKDQVAPPTINLKNPSPLCDLDYIPHQARSGHLTHVMNNSFGFGGTNACLIFSLPEDLK